MSPVRIFQRNTLEGTAKAPAVDLLRLNTQSSTKTAFLPLKDTTSISFFFIWDESKTFVMHKLLVPRQTSPNLL